MHLLNYIKSQVDRSDAVGILAQDVLRDNKFPSQESEIEQIMYLENKASDFPNIEEPLSQLLKEYKKMTSGYATSDKDFLSSNFLVARSEYGQYIKDTFHIDRVYLIGIETDYYKLFVVNKKSKKAFRIDLKSDFDFNYVSIIDEENIYVGNATQILMPYEAARKLRNCPFSTGAKPNTRVLRETLLLLEKYS